MAVETLLTIRELFRLPYRQTEGFGRALAKLMRAEVAIPDYASLQKRPAKLGVSIEVEEFSGPIDVVVDSTGLKVFGDGEWKVKQHGAGKRRMWRKVHLAVDPATHTILAHTLTESGATDASQAEPLLEQIDVPVETFYADGAYDTWKLREHLRGESVHQIIPPRKNAKIKQHGNSAAEGPTHTIRWPGFRGPLQIADGRAAVQRAARTPAGDPGASLQAGSAVADPRGDAPRALPAVDVRPLRSERDGPDCRLRSTRP